MASMTLGHKHTYFECRKTHKLFLTGGHIIFFLKIELIRSAIIECKISTVSKYAYTKVRNAKKTVSEDVNMNQSPIFVQGLLRTCCQKNVSIKENLYNSLFLDTQCYVCSINAYHR